METSRIERQRHAKRRWAYSIFTLWLREFKVFLREKSRLVASIFTPLLWLFVVGTGFGSTISTVGVVNYQQFIFPGILNMSIIFSAIFFGAYIFWCLHNLGQEI